MKKNSGTKPLRMILQEIQWSQMNPQVLSRRSEQMLATYHKSIWIDQMICSCGHRYGEDGDIIRSLMVLGDQTTDPETKDVRIAIRMLSSAEVLDPMIDRTLQAVLMEVENGDIYYHILKDKYIGECCTDKALSLDCHLGRTQLYYRKREALLYFGYIMATRTMPEARKRALEKSE